MTATARRVGRYELVRVIGRGGMAIVHLARQLDLDRDVALKELVLFDGSDPKPARRFLREARLAGSLSHPNIVTVHDYFEQGGTPYIAMEYLPCGSLRPYVGRMSLEQIGGVLQGMLGALAHAERHGVLHRDVKPENVMVTAEGSVKLADFGIAKATNAAVTGTNLTTAGTTLGTPRYMAPERAMGQEVGPWSDLYSVGVMVFELLVGRTPFAETDAPMAVLMRQINDPIPAVQSLVPDVDPELSDWVDSLLVKDPARRTRSAATAWSELEEILIGLLGPRWSREAALPAEPGSAGRRRERRTRTTVRMDREPTAEATVAPATYRMPREPEGAPRARRRRRRLVAPVAAVMLALVTVAAKHAGRQPSSPARAVATSSPGTRYAGVLNATMADLKTRVSGHASRLATASTSSGRAAVLRSIASDYDDAAQTLGALQLSRSDSAANARVVTALQETSRAYRKAASARTAQDAVQPQISAGQAAVDQAVVDAGARRASSSGGRSHVDRSGVGDSRSDDPSDDAPDDGEP